jgi:two-component system sensor histidine kinase ChvG
VISAAVPVDRLMPASPYRRGVMLATINARDVTRIVRAERMRLGIVLLIATLLSVLLSMFLARTIALPLRRLARAAQAVRLGRAREVDVPRLPARRDEIGLLARALADMTGSLRSRIDATRRSPPMSRTSSRTRSPRCGPRSTAWNASTTRTCAASSFRSSGTMSSGSTA